jgi:hypothetical protein
MQGLLVGTQLPMITSYLELGHDLFRDLKLHVDIVDKLISPACQHSHCIFEEPVQPPKRVGIPKRAMPCLLHHLHGVDALRPKRFELKLLLLVEGCIQLQEQGCVVQTKRC